MPRPDFDDPVQRRAYRRELKGVARPWRLVGMALILSGIAVVLVRGAGFDPLSLALVVAGWAMVIVAIVKRGRHHATRMGEGEGGRSPK